MFKIYFCNGSSLICSIRQVLTVAEKRYLLVRLDTGKLDKIPMSKIYRLEKQLDKHQEGDNFQGITKRSA